MIVKMDGRRLKRGHTCRHCNKLFERGQTVLRQDGIGVPSDWFHLECYRERMDEKH